MPGADTVLHAPPGPRPTTPPRRGGEPRPARSFLGGYACTVAGLLTGLVAVVLAGRVVSGAPWVDAHPWPAAIAATLAWQVGAGAWLRRRAWPSATVHAVTWIAPTVLLAPLVGPGWLTAAGLVVWAPATTVLAAALAMAADPGATRGPRPGHYGRARAGRTGR